MVARWMKTMSATGGIKNNQTIESDDTGTRTIDVPTGPLQNHRNKSCIPPGAQWFALIAET